LGRIYYLDGARMYYTLALAWGIVVIQIRKEYS